MSTPLQSLPSAGTITEASDIVYLQQPSQTVKDTKATLTQILSNVYTAITTALLRSNNLSDIVSATAARTNLGLGSAATHAASDFDAAGAASAVSASAAAALALQQVGGYTFSSLTDIFPSAVETAASSVIQWLRTTEHKDSTGKVVYSQLDFQWSTTSANSGSAGWALTSASGTLGANLDTYLRGVWAIGAHPVEWTHPYIFGDVYVNGNRYTLSIYHDGAGAHFTIGGTPLLTMVSFGRVTIYLPGPF
jgi:tartrate dehydratase beta subunit/fumarate hydratase class I family protein